MGKSRKANKKIRQKLFYVFSFLIFILIVGVIAIKFIANDNEKIDTSYKGNRSFQSYVAHFSNYTVFGIDVSEYQKSINWKALSQEKALEFVFIRSTAGNNYVDKNYTTNWHAAKQNGLIRGAYHFYRPNENSSTQAELFIKTVSLTAGDLPPVLDIESFSKIQSLNSLKSGLLNWLDIVEKYYGVCPIIYTFPNMYKTVIKNDDRFNKYPIWIAYLKLGDDASNLVNNWKFRQISHIGLVSGISTDVDINLFNGTYADLQNILIK